MPLGEEFTLADPVLLGRTSMVCFTLGFYLLCIQVVGFIWVLALPYYYVFKSATVSAIIACLWLAYVVLNMFFALYVFKVGRAYHFASLKITALALLGVLFAEITPAILIKPYPPWVLYSGFGPFLSPEVIEVVSLFSWLFLGLSVALVLLFIWGATDMEDETGLKTFGTAKTLMVAGIFIMLAFPIGVMVFASGLQKLGGSK